MPNKSLEFLKTFLLLCFVLLAGYATFTYHSDRYQPVTVQDKLYLVDKRTGATYYPAVVKGKVAWAKWVPALEDNK